MERSPIKDVEIKALLKAALTDRINDRHIYMKGIDASYHYEGYNVFKTENIKNEVTIILYYDDNFIFYRIFLFIRNNVLLNSLYFFPL